MITPCDNNDNNKRKRGGSRQRDTEERTNAAFKELAATPLERKALGEKQGEQVPGMVTAYSPS